MKSKRKPSFKNFEFVDDLYRVRYQLCVGDPGEMEKYLDTKYDIRLETNPYEVDGMQFSITSHNRKKSQKIFFIYLKKASDKNTLAHELIHLVSDIFMDRGISVDMEKDQEAFSYYHSYLMDVFTKKLKKPRKKILTKKK